MINPVPALFLTKQFLKVIREVLSEGVWSRVVNLPQALMAKARSQREHAPVRAAVAAQLAVAIAILTVAPVRLGNLTSIQLESNLIKPGGPEGKYWLVFPDYDVKNRVKLEYPLDEVVTAVINEYVHDFRPILIRGHNENWLFPGQDGGSKDAISFSTQIVKSILKSTGFRLTVHQFRHAAGALILKKYPGNYEMVRRVLGHQSVRTTMNFYCGLETTQANEIFGKLVRDHANFHPEAGPSLRGSRGKRSADGPRSLLFAEWSRADRQAWQEACRPACRLTRGGAASHLAAVSRDDFQRRYGACLGFVDRSKRLDLEAAHAAACVTPKNVEDYIADLQARVRSVTVWNCIYKLRRAAELLFMASDFSWLAEIEKDLALIAIPRSKFDRLVMTERLLEAGLTLIAEAEAFAKSDLARAKGVRNGLMIAILALCPIRLKNFAALGLGRTFLEIDGTWWIALPQGATKTGRPDERAVPSLLKRPIDTYVNQYRQIFACSDRPTNALWISSTSGQSLTPKNMGTLISKITRETIGVDVSPHLFRTAAASTAAIYGGDTPYLASALLQHTDPRVTEDYKRASSMSAVLDYAGITDTFRCK